MARQQLAQKHACEGDSLLLMKMGWLLHLCIVSIYQESAQRGHKREVNGEAQKERCARRSRRHRWPQWSTGGSEGLWPGTSGTG